MWVTTSVLTPCVLIGEERLGGGFVATPPPITMPGALRGVGVLPGPGTLSGSPRTARLHALRSGRPSWTWPGSAAVREAARRPRRRPVHGRVSIKLYWQKRAGGRPGLEAWVPPICVLCGPRPLEGALVTLTGRAGASGTGAATGQACASAGAPHLLGGGAGFAPAAGMGEQGHRVCGGDRLTASGWGAVTVAGGQSLMGRCEQADPMSPVRQG